MYIDLGIETTATSEITFQLTVLENLNKYVGSKKFRVETIMTILF